MELSVFSTRSSISSNARTLVKNSIIPEKRVRLILNDKELSELPKNSTDIYKKYAKYVLH